MRKVRKFYIDLDPKVKVLEYTMEDAMGPQQMRGDTRTNLTSSRSQMQQPSIGGTAPTGAQPMGGPTTGQTTGQGGVPQISGQSVSDLKESSHQSVSDKTLPSISGMLKAESDISLRDEATQGQEDLPVDLLRPLKILERLLAQSNYHKQQVRYKDYPFTAARKPPEEKKDGHRE